MTVSDTKPIVWVGIGLFVGVLLTLVITIAITRSNSGSDESFEAYNRRMQGDQAQPSMPAGHPPMSGQGQQQPPPAQGPAPDAGHGGGMDRAQESFAKVHFMKEFVAALTKAPDNMFPNPDYVSPMKEGAQPIVCADCHDPSKVNMEGMMRNDPGSEAVEPFRRQKRAFMIPLMKAWVKRLNERHADRLKAPVTCTTCHAWDPSSGEGNQVLPPLMGAFVRALKTKPENGNPAPNWKPLLKDPSTPSMLCGACHGPIGEAMDKNFASFPQEPDPKWAKDKKFMVHLMESWVSKLNVAMKDQLVKAVTCIDCHATDPRR